MAALAGIGQVSLLVRDVDRAVAFYRDVLGLGHLFTAGTLAFFDLAGVRLYLQGGDHEQWRPGSVLYFLVDDIQPAYETLEASGVTMVSPPHAIYDDQAAGLQEWMAFFEDPDGNTLALMSRVPLPA